MIRCFCLDPGRGSARVLLHQALHLASVVATACERAAHHLQEPQLGFAVLAEALKLLWTDEAIDGQVFGPRREVLADRDDVDGVAA